MNRLALMGIALLFTLAGCSKETHTGSITVTQGGNGVAMAGVHRDGQLIYAFVWPVDIPKVDTNDVSLKPSDKGIHFLSTAADGLWIYGKKVAIPSKVFALSRDGTAEPISLSDAELQQVTAWTRPNEITETVPDGPLKDKLLAPLKAGDPKQ